MLCAKRAPKKPTCLIKDLMTRLKSYVKILYHIVCIIVLSCIIRERNHKVVTLKYVDRFLHDLKHILIWTDIKGITHEGQLDLLTKHCYKTNCFFTKNRDIFGDVRYFDAIIFNLQDVSASAYDLPAKRGVHQKYVFAANDSADNYPVCSPFYDDFFNWTWTYRHDSTIRYKFITIFNELNQELGSHFQWKQTMDPIKPLQKNQLLLKKKAVAVFLDTCESRSKREEFIAKLDVQLSKFDLHIDVFGACGKKCKKARNVCLWDIKKHYYFYLACEDSFATDFITDAVLVAYNNDVVPIVFGGADYDKFLPPGSYINAMLLTEADLAKKIHNFIGNLEQYSNFFRWRNHYKIVKSPSLDICGLCEFFNDPHWLISKTSYKNFRRWWNSNFERRCDIGFIL